jgi:hypothetical protein
VGELFGAEVDSDEFFKLVTIGKMITDFKAPDEAQVTSGLISQTRCRKTDSNVQSSLDKRDILEREMAYTRGFVCAFCLVSQAECATFSGGIL